METIWGIKKKKIISHLSRNTNHEVILVMSKMNGFTTQNNLFGMHITTATLDTGLDHSLSQRQKSG